MVRPVILFLSLLPLVLSAQQEGAFARKGLLRAQATISPGFLLQHPLTHINVAAGAEYLLEDRVGLRGDALWYLDSQKADPIVAENSRTLIGACLHFPHGNGDAYTGFQTGIGICQPLSDRQDGSVQPLRIVPAASFIAGYSHYVWEHIHFFAEARYVRSRYMRMEERSLLLDELMLAAGIGWQIRLR